MASIYLKRRKSLKNFHHDCSIINYASIIDTFEQLRQTLIGLKEIPLSIVGVKCISGYYRRTKVY